MGDKKVYAIVTKGTATYAAHIEERRLGSEFDSKQIVTKAEYRKARNDGMPSLGELETKTTKDNAIIEKISRGINVDAVLRARQNRC